MEPQLSPSELTKIQTKWPGRIPVFVLRSRSASPDLPVLPRQKFVVPRSLTLGQFMYVVRKHLTIPPEQALFLFIGNTLPTTNTMMFELYDRYKSPDGALRIIYTSESTFG